MGTGRCRANARSKVAAAAAAATVRRGRAGGATASELRHRDRLACLAAGSLFERLRDGATVRIVELRAWVIVVRLVRIEVRQGRDCVRVWLKLRSRVGRGGRCVSERTSPRVCGRVEAGSARPVCWQGDGSVVGVEFWPLNLLICVTMSVWLRRKKIVKHEAVIVARQRVDRFGGEENTHCCHSRPTASG